jgi:superoxide dismutase, Cu-Zn family
MQQSVTRGRRFHWMLSVALALAGCGSATEPRGGNDRVTATFSHGFSGPIIDSSGKRIGSVTGRPDSQGLIVAFDVSGFSPGQHGMHLHNVGRCDPPSFESSGTHWNASGHKHGTDNPQGPHDGDWDNLDIGADGRGSNNRLIPRWHGKIPESGLSLVFHSNKDDEVTDPSGNSGARIACAVIIPEAR